MNGHVSSDSDSEGTEIESERNENGDKDNDCEMDKNDHEAVSLDDIFRDHDNRGGLTLPRHQRCGAHLLNLLATTDAREALEKNSAYKKVHDSTDGKLRIWWNHQNRSDIIANAIQAGLGVKFQVPVETRWNSEFDAKEQLVKLFDKDDEKFNKTLESAGLQKLVTSEWRYLREYVWVMQPVAFALDILQRDKNMYLGYLLPTIASMERNLKARSTFQGKPLKYCQALLDTLLTATRNSRRFGPYFDDEELHTAAALIPCFKLNWIENYPQLQGEVKSRLLKELASVTADGEIREVNPAPARRRTNEE